MSGPTDTTAANPALDNAWKGVLAAIYDSFGQIPKNVGDALERFKDAKIESPSPARDLYLEVADKLLPTLREPLARALEEQGL